MLFNSFDFLVFFIVTYIVFFYSRGIARHLFLLIASCVFYSWFIPKYLIILFTLILIDYFAAIQIEKYENSKKRKIILLIAIINTCSVLFIFKYHNFFIDNINSISGKNFKHWNLILPIGLSFHTFQSLSYVIDVYWKKVKAEKNLLLYANYVMMFPQLVAGPIERAGHLLPQLKNSLQNKIESSDFSLGMSMFFYGLFKKIVVADNLGNYVDAVYNNSIHHNSTTLLFATMLFSIQIYADFSGYSDMAIGIARTLGFKFSDNFKTPYFSKSITEFWRRWHISLSSWLRDYMYYPLSLSFGRVTKIKLYLITFITFTIIGLWHGAAWTFVIFGMIHGFYLVIEMFTDKIRRNISKLTIITKFSRIHHALQMAAVFLLVSISFIFFRAKNLDQALYIFKKITYDFSLNHLNLLDTTTFATIIFSIIILFFSEYFIFNKYSFEDIFNMKNGKLFLSSLIIFSIITILSFGQIGSNSFIYFQF